MAIQFKRGTRAQWLASTTVLAAGQPGVATDTGETRVGDGANVWANLKPVVDVDARLGGPAAGLLTSNGKVAESKLPDLSATYATAGVEATQRVMNLLNNGSRDISILFLGDSTGNEQSEWIYRLTQSLGADWPAWTVAYRLWDDTGLVYAAPATVQTGTGPRTLTVYNCSVAGATTMYFQGAKFASCVAPLTPDLTVISLGHNEGSVPELWFPQYVNFAEQVSEAVPGSDILLIGQNPATNYTFQAPRVEVYRDIAARRGYGFIDVHQAFLDVDPAVSSLLIDGIHPNVTGSQLWANTVKAAFKLDRKRSPRTQPPSTLTETGEQLLVNGDFADFPGAIPTGWTTSLTPTLAKDTGLYESGAGYSVKITTPTTGGSIQQTLPLNKVKGRWITVSARVHVTPGQGNVPGRIAVVDSTGSTTSNGNLYGRGAWRWEVVTRFVPASATYARVVLYGDTSGGTGFANYSEVTCVVGRFPKRAANGSRGLTGPAGVVAGQIDFMSTVGNLGSFLYAVASSVAFTVANQAILVEFRPHRDVTVNSLVWFTGGTVSGNYDIGLYDSAGNRLWSKGTTAWPTASTRTAETVAPAVALTAGSQYFIALAGDNTTALFRGIAESFTDQVKTVTGNYLARSVAASFPLPASLTVANVRAGRYPAITVHGT